MSEFFSYADQFYSLLVARLTKIFGSKQKLQRVSPTFITHCRVKLSGRDQPMLF